MRILLWHVHGSWTTAFVTGRHEYVLPVLPSRGADGIGRARTWHWPASSRELPPDGLRDAEPDVVVLQRPHELRLVEEWTGRRPGRDLPAVYLEHNTPGGDVPYTRHPLADRDDIPVVHVTHFNDLMWDTGSARTVVVEHGVVDPGPRYTGERERAAVVVNDPVRRGRAVGTDLVLDVARSAPVDVFGLGSAPLAAEAGPDRDLATYGGLSQHRLHDELARRRVYLHTSRWTSLGLSLLEAMHLAMPVVVVAATEAPVAVPPEAGVVVTRRDDLAPAVRRFLADPDLAGATGRAARRAALAHYGLERFLREWDEVLDEVTAGAHR